MLKRGVPRKSCDLCRKRKVRCDRGESEALQQCCSYCKLRGVECVLPTESKRLSTIRQGQGHQVSLQQCSSQILVAPLQAPTSDLSHTISFNLEELFPEYAAGQNVLASTSSLPLDFIDPHHHSTTESSLVSLSSSSVSNHSQPAYVFDVAGLTQDILDESIACYFAQVSHTLPLLDPIKFYTQYNSLLLMNNSTNQQHILQYSATISSPTHLLTLSIAMKGIGYTSQPERFQLQECMMMRFLSVFSKDSNPLDEGGLAVLQSLILVSDLVMTDSMEQAWLECKENPLQLHPLSHEALVSLAFHFIRRGQQDESRRKKSSSEGELVDDEDTRVEVATALRFIFILDAFHSRGECFPQIRDEQADMFLMSAEDQEGMSSSQGESDRRYLATLTSLSVVARILHRSLISLKSIKNGVDGRDVLTQTQRVLLFYSSSVPAELKWEPKKNHDPSHHPPPMIRAAIIRCLWLFQLMAIESAVTEYGIAGDVMEKMEATQTVSTQTRATFMQVVEMAQVCTPLRYFDQSVAVMRNLVAGCIQWAISELAKLAPSTPNSDIGSQRSSSSSYFTSKEEILPLLEILFVAMESATSHADTATGCIRLKAGLEAVMALF